MGCGNLLRAPRRSLPGSAESELYLGFSSVIPDFAKHNYVILPGFIPCCGNACRENHRIKESLGLEKTSKIPKFKPNPSHHAH